VVLVEVMEGKEGKEDVEEVGKDGVEEVGKDGVEEVGKDGVVVDAKEELKEVFPSATLVSVEVLAGTSQLL
jgi:hypothetical protein